MGNPQAQQSYASELARALSDMQRAQSDRARGEALASPQYIPNSGLLGSLAMAAQSYAGKKVRERSSKEEAEARERFYSGQEGMARQKAAEEARRKQEAADADMARNEDILRSGDPIKIAAAGLKAPSGPDYELREVGGKLYYVPKQPG